ncbi:MAG TPA: iron ABC transporter permease [Polyangiaceae bacterium]|nr:iron ABC transporter permease [Polyangiaceae bacterium]
MSSKPRVLLLSAASLAVMAGSLFVGPAFDGPHASFVLLELRLPRLLVAMLVGAALALSGAAFQILFNNPLATPSTIGTLSGATLGALASIVLGVDAELWGLSATTLCAFVGALLTSLFALGVAVSGRARMSDVLLAGIAIGLSTSALATGLEYAADSRMVFAASRWSLGQLPQVGYRGVWLLLPIVVLTTAVTLSQTRALSSFMLGEEMARAQGVHIGRLRSIVLVNASLAVAAVVAWCGPIAFVGLIVPHLVRLSVGASLRLVLPLSVVVGAGFLAFADGLSRALLPGRELPVGVLTAALGAPALIWLLARQRR